MNRSRLVMLLMLVVAAGFAAISVAFYHSMNRRVIQFWGADETRLIMDAPKVEALRLALSPRLKLSPARAPPQETLNLPEGTYAVLERRDVSAAGGLEALRHGLLEDANYDWSNESSIFGSRWQYALVFSDGSKRRTVLFDFSNRFIECAETGANVFLAESAASWEKFFTEVFAAPR